MHVPTEVEIREFAKQIGALDENGNYTEPRSVLAKGAQKYFDDLATLEREGPPPTQVATSLQLRRFRDELREEFKDSDPSLARALVLAIAPSLVRRQGLHLNTKGNPQP